MQTRLYTTLLLAGATLAMGESALADPPPTVEQLQKQMGEMQNRMDALRGRLGEDWMTEQRAEEIRGLVYDVLADADTRASLLQSGMTAGYDKKFFLASADGNFRLNLQGQIQARYVYNHQDDGPGGTNTLDANRSGFEIRRAKLSFSGNVFDPSITYKVKAAFARSGGEFVSEDAWIQKKFDNGITVRAGQFKGPFLREETLSSSKQLAVDRSIVNERWNQDFSIGAQVGYAADSWRINGMFHNGMGRNLGLDLRSRRTGWDAEDTEFAFAARTEFLLAGEWGQFKDFTSPRGSEFALMIGGAIVYQKQEYGTSGAGTLSPQFRPGVDNEITDLRLTADVSVEGDGWNAYAAFVWSDVDNDTSSSDPAHLDQSPWGFLVQGGLYLTDDWEVFGRYEFGDNDDSGPASAEDLSVITVGANRYFHQHALKWTTDFGYGLNALESPWGPQLGVGWRRDSAGEDGQYVVRSQLQLLF